MTHVRATLTNGVIVEAANYNDIDWDLVLDPGVEVDRVEIVAGDLVIPAEVPEVEVEHFEDLWDTRFDHVDEDLHGHHEVAGFAGFLGAFREYVNEIANELRGEGDFDARLVALDRVTSLARVGVAGPRLVNSAWNIAHDIVDR